MNWQLFCRHLLASAWAVKKTLIAMFLVTLLLGATYLNFEQPKYKTSWVVLLPGTERASTINLDNLGEARSNGKNAYGSVSISPKNTYKEIALSDAVIKRAASEYQIEAHAFSKPRIKLVDQTPAMSFSLKGDSIDELRYRAELYNRTFHSVLDELRNNEIERHFKGVEGNLSEAKKRLTAAREAMIEYQTASSIVSDQQFQTWLSDAEALRTQQSKIEVALASQESMIKAQLKQLGITAQQAQAFLLLQANPANQFAMSMLSEKLAKHASISQIYGAQNPIKKQLDGEIAGIRRSLAQSLISVPELNTISRPQLYGLLSKQMGETLRSVNQQLAELEATNAQADIIATQRQQYAARIKAHTREAARLTDLKRDHQIAEAIFSSALTKLDTNRLDIYATYPLTQLLTQPGDTIKRDRLQAKLILVALFLIFGLLSLAMVLIRLRHTIANQAYFAAGHAQNSQGEPHDH